MYQNTGTLLHSVLWFFYPCKIRFSTGVYIHQRTRLSGGIMQRQILIGLDFSNKLFELFCFFQFYHGISHPPPFCFLLSFFLSRCGVISCVCRVVVVVVVQPHWQTTDHFPSEFMTKPQNIFPTYRDTTVYTRDFSLFNPQPCCLLL